ncbi:MAG TPA: TlpA disulfide reductase family protein [Aliidongia sp.]|uniref:TlpA family protein disulfide reductase n=1 Tax=Aliidongia sp. TaxID=1914230 RepID=UPI002DDCF806|nr:TlpA disulfide reductase family protein [Aliidongia sp.]HEV2677651.1 TlpA disulfide reductase family protein [Aliidongia sp.]
MGLKIKLFILTLLLVTGGAVATALADKGDAPPLGGAMHEFILQTPPAPAPDVTFSDGENATLGFKDFKGKVTLVNLWATWCAPCVKEMPSLEALKKAHGGADFDVVTISEDRGARKVVDPFFEKNGLAALPRYIDAESAVGRAFRVRGLPTTVLLDRDGNEIGRFEGGADWSGPDALALIDWAIKGGTPKPDTLPPVQKTP